MPLLEHLLPSVAVALSISLLRGRGMAVLFLKLYFLFGLLGGRRGHGWAQLERPAKDCPGTGGVRGPALNDLAGRRVRTPASFGGTGDNVFEGANPSLPRVELNSVLRVRFVLGFETLRARKRPPLSC